MTAHRHAWSFADDSPYPSCPCGAEMRDGVILESGEPESEPVLEITPDVAEAFDAKGAQGAMRLDEVAALPDETWERILELRGGTPPDPVGWEQLENELNDAVRRGDDLALEVTRLKDHVRDAEGRCARLEADALLADDRSWDLYLPPVDGRQERLLVGPVRRRPEADGQPPLTGGARASSGDSERLIQLERDYLELASRVSGENVAPEDLRRHWRNAIELAKFWREAYVNDVGDPDRELQWQSWRKRAEQAEAKLKRLEKDV